MRPVKDMEVSQQNFGYKKLEDKVLPHQGERLLIEALKDFGADALTYRQISLRLTTLKIPSKKGETKWQPMMVKRILDAFKNEIDSKI